jgi:hypothetical protein
MWRSIVLCGLLLGALLLLPLPVTFACRGGCPSGSSSRSTYSSNNQGISQPLNNEKSYTESLNFMFQFDIGCDVSSIEIAPVGSNDWKPFVGDSSKPMYIRSGRIAHFRQDIFDNMYTFDIRINGAVVWHNIEVRNERLIVLGYNNGPIIVAVIDHYRK